MLWKLDILTLKLSVNWRWNREEDSCLRKLWLLEVKYTHNSYSAYDKPKIHKASRQILITSNRTWKLKSSLPLIAFHYFCKIIIKFFFSFNSVLYLCLMSFPDKSSHNNLSEEMAFKFHSFLNSVCSKELQMTINFN